MNGAEPTEGCRTYLVKIKNKRVLEAAVEKYECEEEKLLLLLNPTKNLEMV